MSASMSLPTPGTETLALVTRTVTLDAPARGLRPLQLLTAELDAERDRQAAALLPLLTETSMLPASFDSGAVAGWRLTFGSEPSLPSSSFGALPLAASVRLARRESRSVAAHRPPERRRLRRRLGLLHRFGELRIEHDVFGVGAGILLLDDRGRSSFFSATGSDQSREQQEPEPTRTVACRIAWKRAIYPSGNFRANRPSFR